MSGVSPALIEQLAKALRHAPKPAFDPFTGEMDARSAEGIVDTFAPILSSALTEAWADANQSAVQIADRSLVSLETLLTAAQEEMSADETADGEEAVAMLARIRNTIRAIPNPYLTEKEH